MPLPPIHAMNRALEAHGDLPLSCWHEWLWECDPHEPMSKRVLFNRSHLLGILLCRFWAVATPEVRAHIQHPSERGRVGTLPRAEGAERVTLMDKSPALMTLRELRDTVDNLTIELPEFAGAQCTPSEAVERVTVIETIANESFARLGALASTVQCEEVMDDPTAVEQVAPGQFKLAKPFLRRSVCVFLALFRNIHLWTRARRVPPDAADVTPLVAAIKKHHIEASNDDFHLLCMHHTLPIGATLVYKVDFAGMYNHISQVVYFNNSKYERRCRPTLEEIAQGDPMHCLPAIMQLHPDVKVVHETDHGDITAPDDAWRWAVFPGMVYLIDPRGTVYHSPNAMQLYHVYSKKNGRHKRPRDA